MKISVRRAAWFHGQTVCFNNKHLSNIDDKYIFSGSHVATITKLWGGCCRETVLDADNFVIEFYLNMSVEEKAMILATAFLVDLMYFSNQ